MGTISFYSREGGVIALEKAAEVAESIFKRGLVPEGHELVILKPHAAHYALVVGGGTFLTEGEHYQVRPIFRVAQALAA